MKVIKSILTTAIFMMSVFIGMLLIGVNPPLVAEATGLETYSVVYNLNEGINNPNNPVSYTNQQDFFFGYPERYGYDFKGWFTTSSFDTNTLITEAPELLNDGDTLTLYAKWVQNPLITVHSPYDETPNEYALPLSSPMPTYTSASSLMVGTRHFEVADYLNDGSMDTIYSSLGTGVADIYAYNIDTAMNTLLGSITVNAAVNIEIVTDFNNDNIIDIVAQYGSNMYIVPSLDFSKTLTVALGTGSNIIKELLLGDFDGDGKDDIFVKHYSSNTIPTIKVFSISIDSSLQVTANNSLDQWIYSYIYNYDVFDMNDDGKDEVIILGQRVIITYSYIAGSDYVDNGGASNIPTMTNMSSIKVGRYFGGLTNYVIYTSINPDSPQQKQVNQIKFNGVVVASASERVGVPRDIFGFGYETFDIVEMNSIGRYYMIWRTYNDSNSKSFLTSYRTSGSTSWNDTKEISATSATYIELTHSDFYLTDTLLYQVQGSTIANGSGSVGTTTSQSTFKMQYDPSYSITGYTTTGYYLTPDYTGSSINITNLAITENTDVYAKLTPNTVYITWNTTGGTSIAQSSGLYGETISEPIAPTRSGYNFSGWYRDYALTTPWDFSNTIDTSGTTMSLYAKWTPLEYTITYNLNEGINDIGNPESYMTTTSTFQLRDATKEGYTFAGWYSDSDFTAEVTQITVGSTGSITLYAKFVSLPPTITPVTTDFTIEASNNSQINLMDYFTFEDDFTDIEDLNISFSNNEIPFLSSNFIPNFLGELVVTVKVKDEDNNETTEVFTFTIVDTTAPVIYLYQTDTVVTELDYLFFMDIFDMYGGELSIPRYIWEDDLVFTYSYEDNGHEYTYTQEDVMSWFGTITEPGQYDLVAYISDNSGNTTTLTYNFTVVYLTNMFELTSNYYVKPNVDLDLTSLELGKGLEAYTLVYDDSEVSNELGSYEIHVGLVDSLTDTLVFEHSYEITVTDEDYFYPVITASDFSLPAGYTLPDLSTFYSIVDDSEFTFELTHSIDSLTPGNYSLVITATDSYGNESTKPVTVTILPYVNYEITFDTNGGSTQDTLGFDYLSTVVLPDNPVKVGYTFTGWYKDSALTQVYVVSTMEDQNYTLFAKWTINQYTISFNAAGGSETATINADFGSVVTTPANPTRSGYLFNGWDTALPSTMPAQNLVFTAKWLQINQPSLTSGVVVEGMLEAIDDELYVNKDVSIVLTVDFVLEDSVQSSILDIIQSYITSNLQYSNGELVYLDIEVLLQEGANTTVLSEVSGLITFTIDIPQERQGYSNYQIVRVHNGVAELIESTYDEESQTISFETNRFSTYTIIYETSSFNWWLLLLLLLPVGYLVYRYNKEKRVIIQENTTKKTK